jgi:hypothetical protein
MNLLVNAYLLKPYAHVVIFLAVTVAIFVLLRPKDANALYTMAGVVYAVFILTNSILIFFAQNTWTYFFTSLLLSISYILAVAPLSSIYIRMAKVEGSGESAMMFLVIIYHPLAMLFVIFLKWIMSKI